MGAAVTADRLFVLLLAVVGSVGPGLADRSARLLDPELSVALAWERGGAGSLAPDWTVPDAAGPVRVNGRLVPDPWGFPLHREWQSVRSRCAITAVACAQSYGPDGVPSADDVVVRDPANWPAWQRLAASCPWLVTLLAVIYHAVAWPILRSRPRTRLVDTGIAVLVVLPLAPVAVALGATDATARLTADLPVVIPSSFAVPVSLWVLALLLAFAVRVSPRPEPGDTAGA